MLPLFAIIFLAVIAAYVAWIIYYREEFYRYFGDTSTISPGRKAAVYICEGIIILLLNFFDDSLGITQRMSWVLIVVVVILSMITFNVIERGKPRK